MKRTKFYEDCNYNYCEGCTYVAVVDYQYNIKLYSLNYIDRYNLDFRKIKAWACLTDYEVDRLNKVAMA